MSDVTVIDSEISRLEGICAISRCSHSQGEFISNVFCRMKSNGKGRVILNLRQLNDCVLYEHFKMEHLDFVTDLVYDDDWFCSIDLKDAYFALPIDSSCWKYLRFYWNNQLWEYRVLVFGLSSAPRVFTRLCKPILAWIRGHLGIRCSMYIDDLIIMEQSKSKLMKSVSEIYNLLVGLGFQINHEKSVLKPTQTIKHLGFDIDSTKLTIGLPVDKCVDIEEKCNNIITYNGTLSIRTIASFLGSARAFTKGTKWGRLFVTALDREKVKALVKSGGAYDRNILISSSTINNISWWLKDEKNIPHFFGHLDFELKLFSDASLQGWGGHDNKSSTGGRWSVEERKHSINWLELLAAFFTLKSFAKELSNCNIILYIDNKCAVHYVNNQGGVVRQLDNLAQEVWQWCKIRNIWIKAVHIPGVSNVTADNRSRKFNDNIEWCLNKDLFDHIVQKWGPPSVDLFASRVNHQIDTYVSLGKEPDSIAVDAFSLSWKAFPLCYAFPPFNLIGKVLSKCRYDKAQLLLVVPNWTTQHWYPILKDLLVIEEENPMILHSSPKTITLPYKDDSVHPIWHRLNLMCCRLDGNL